MMSGRQNDYQQVISDGKKQEGRIHHSHEKWTEVAEVKQQVQQMLEKARQDVIVAGREGSKLIGIFTGCSKARFRIAVHGGRYAATWCVTSHQFGETAIRSEAARFNCPQAA